MNSRDIKKAKEKEDKWREKNHNLSLRAKSNPPQHTHHPKKKKHKKRKVHPKPQLIFENYKEYMKSNAWKVKRKLVLERAKGMCESCGIKRATQIHHKTYKHLYNEPLKDLIALCGICHQDKHKLLTQDYIDKKMYEMMQAQ